MKSKRERKPAQLPIGLETKIRRFFQRIEQSEDPTIPEWMDRLESLHNEVNIYVPNPLQIVDPGLHDYHHLDLFIDQIHPFYFEYYLRKAAFYLDQYDLPRAKSALLSLEGFLPIPSRSQRNLVDHYNRFLDLTSYLLDVEGHNPYPALYEKWQMILKGTTNQKVKIHYLTMLADWIPLHQPLLLFVLQTLHRLEKSSHSEASLRYFAHVAELSKQWRQALYYQTLALRLSSPQESTDLLARRAMVLYQQGNVSLANATMNQAFRAIETYHWSTIPKHILEDTLRIAKQFFHALSDLDAVNQVVGLEMQMAN